MTMHYSALDWEFACRQAAKWAAEAEAKKAAERKRQENAERTFAGGVCPHLAAMLDGD